MYDEIKLTAYPLTWPAGWRRTKHRDRIRPRFGKRGNPQTESGWRSLQNISVHEAVKRVLHQLNQFGADGVLISTNVPMRNDGLPRSGFRQPDEPGAAVYWWTHKQAKCMAIDNYETVEGNIAAIAATLEAMRAIERHGGTEILDRAFVGFKALPAPEQWWQALGLENERATREQIIQAHRKLAQVHHPDRGGTDNQMARINEARDRGFELAPV